MRIVYREWSWYYADMNVLKNFAVFEGGDGTGTSTQIKMLSRRFEEHGSEVSAAPLPPLFTTCEPTGDPIGRVIRSCLKGETVFRPETLARLFAADRGEHLYGPGGIVERAGRGEFVVSDRYSPSSLVYQGIACGNDLPRLLNEAFPLPELIIILDLDPHIAAERIRHREEKEIFEYLEFQIRVRRAYLDLIPYYRERGARVELVDARESPETVALAVWNFIREMPIFQERRICG
ncbi:MAG: dTMP kinase [Treponema sp.]|nr:dTMP kinase [Treponema sp.]